MISLVRDVREFALLGAYPIPVNDRLMVTYSAKEAAPVTLTLTDVTGRVVLTDQFNAEAGLQQHGVDVSHLARGTYMLKLSDGLHTDMRRIVKQ